MHYYEVAPDRVFRAASGTLTYHWDAPLKPGTIVAIPLGRATASGIILRAVSQPNFTTKPLSRVIYDTPLPPHLLAAARWLSDYYLCPLPDVVKAILPSGVAKQRRAVK
jgi:primosomal protein N' (replication factor Y)